MIAHYEDLQESEASENLRQKVRKPRSIRKKETEKWAEENAKLQAAHRNRGIYEVLTDDKDYFKVIADARLKLEKHIALAVPCFVREDSRGKPQTCTTSIDASKDSIRFRKYRSMRKSAATTYGPHRRERVCGEVSFGLVHKPVSIREAVKISEWRAAVDKEWVFFKKKRRRKFQCGM